VLLEQCFHRLPRAVSQLITQEIILYNFDHSVPMFKTLFGVIMPLSAQPQSNS